MVVLIVLFSFSASADFGYTVLTTCDASTFNDCGIIQSSIYSYSPAGSLGTNQTISFEYNAGQIHCYDKYAVDIAYYDDDDWVLLDSNITYDSSTETYSISAETDYLGYIAIVSNEMCVVSDCSFGAYGLDPFSGTVGSDEDLEFTFCSFVPTCNSDSGVCDVNCVYGVNLDCGTCTSASGDCCLPSEDGVCDYDCYDDADPDCCNSEEDLCCSGGSIITGCCNPASDGSCDSDCGDGIDPDCCDSDDATCCDTSCDGVCKSSCIAGVDPDCWGGCVDATEPACDKNKNASSGYNYWWYDVGNWSVSGCIPARSDHKCSHSIGCNCNGQNFCGYHDAGKNVSWWAFGCNEAIWEITCKYTTNRDECTTIDPTGGSSNVSSGAYCDTNGTGLISSSCLCGNGGWTAPYYSIYTWGFCCDYETYGSTIGYIAISGVDTYWSHEPCGSSSGSDDDEDYTCFVAGTKVTMVDGSLKNIEDVKIGENVRGRNGVINNIIGYERPIIGSRSTYIINGKIEFTGDHPFLTKDGEWKVVDVELYYRFTRGFDIKPNQLKVGDILVVDGGEEEVVSLEELRTRPSEEIVYDLKLDGDNIYIANGFVVHNCDAPGPDPEGPSDGPAPGGTPSGDIGGDTCFIAGTQVKMANHELKNIENIKIGEKVLGKSNKINIVIGYERPIIGSRSTYIINNKIEFTGDHPFLSTDGWKVADLDLFNKYPRELEQQPSKLKIGDILLTEKGWEEVYKIEKTNNRQSDEIVYDLKLTGDQTYIANRFIVHNC